MRVSIVVPAWNGRSYLPACLEALLTQAYPDFEVIVVDNASTDGSADLVAEKYPLARLIRNKRNLGFSGGCNAGMRAAQGEAIILLNQDTRVFPGWLTALVGASGKPRWALWGQRALSGWSAATRWRVGRVAARLHASLWLPGVGSWAVGDRPRGGIRHRCDDGYSAWGH
jgi:glycosyltransferase involved in cell wall biosynthesis